MAGKQADIKVGVVTNYDDKGIKQAKTGLDGFRSSIAEADGVGGKFSAGWDNIKSQVSANAGALAVAAGASLVAFGVKAVGAFTDTAKAALDLGSATGLAVEDASRWIAVGDDFEVGADKLTAGIGKIAKSLDEPKWGKYGIATRDAAGEARNANDVLLDSLTMLSSVTNETERARIGNALFGKGYANLAPLIGHTREEYENMLGSVEEGQVITEQEAKKAEKFRLAQDQLGDALHEVTLQVGEQVAGLAPLIVGLAKLIGLLDDVERGLGGNKFRESTDELRNYRDEIEAAGLDFGEFDQKLITGEMTIDDVKEAIKEASEALGLFDASTRDAEKSWETQTEWLDKVAVATSETDRETRRLTEGMKGGNEAFEQAKPPIDNASRALGEFRETIAEVDGAYRALTGKLDEEEAWEKVNESIKEFGKGTKASAEEVRGITRDIADYVVNTDTIPATKKTEIIALLDEGKLEYAKAVLAEVTKNRDIYLNLIATGSGDIIAKLGAVGAKAAGGPVSAGKNYLVGEEGPEIVHMGAPGTVIPNDALGGGGGVSIANLTINMPVGSTGDDVVRKLQKFESRNGPGWRAPSPGISGGTP